MVKHSCMQDCSPSKRGCQDSHSTATAPSPKRARLPPCSVPECNSSNDTYQDLCERAAACVECKSPTTHYIGNTARLDPSRDEDSEPPPEEIALQHQTVLNTRGSGSSCDRSHHIEEGKPSQLHHHPLIVAEISIPTLQQRQLQHQHYHHQGHGQILLHNEQHHAEQQRILAGAASFLNHPSAYHPVSDATLQQPVDSSALGAGQGKQWHSHSPSPACQDHRPQCIKPTALPHPCDKPSPTAVAASHTTLGPTLTPPNHTAPLAQILSSATHLSTSQMTGCTQTPSSDPPVPSSQLSQANSAGASSASAVGDVTPASMARAALQFVGLLPSQLSQERQLLLPSTSVLPGSGLEPAGSLGHISFGVARVGDCCMPLMLLWDMVPRIDCACGQCWPGVGSCSRTYSMDSTLSLCGGNCKGHFPARITKVLGFFRVSHRSSEQYVCMHQFASLTSSMSIPFPKMTN